MFPSSGLLADVKCPHLDRGLCKRPRCLYKHVLTARDVSGASYKSTAEVQKSCRSSTCEASASDETRVTLQELEWINKEIETVRHQVEREQRRLSRYQSTQADGRNTVPQISVSMPAGKHGAIGSCEPPTCIDLTERYSIVRKYVVDNSKPRTDLEYDPLSNFSADLRSRYSSGTEPKAKIVEALKRDKDTVPLEQRKPAAQAQLFQRSSPEPLDDFIDSVLIIDIPPSPGEKRGHMKTLVDCDADKSSGTVGQLQVTSPFGPSAEMNEVCLNCDVGNDQTVSFENIGCEKIPIDEPVIDLTSEEMGSEYQKMLRQTVAREENTVTLAASGKQDQSCKSLEVKKEESRFQIDLPQRKLTTSEKLNPLQLYNFPSEKAVISSSPCRQLNKQAQGSDTPDQTHRSPKQSPTPSVPTSPEISSKMPVLMQGEAVINQTSPVMDLEQAYRASGTNQPQSQHSSSSIVDSHLTNRADSSSEQLLVMASEEDVIIISSSEEEEELNYSDIELSESDPMEECYKIFMEANNKLQGKDEPTGVSVDGINVDQPVLSVTSQTLPGKKRVAHDSIHSEQPVAKRPQPQVLVPFREPKAQFPLRWKGGQAFVSQTCQTKPETQTTAATPTQTHGITQQAPMQSARVNYLSLGTAVIDVGNNLQLILPEGAFPLPGPSGFSPVTSVLTPVGQDHRGIHVGFKQICHKAAVNPVQRYHPTAPVLIPALTRKPSLTSAHLTQASPAASQPAAHPPAPKPVAAKRKPKQQVEVAKVPHDVRQRYVNMFTEEFLKTTANVKDAFEKAVAEERTVYNRSANKLRYLSIAVNSLKRLKNKNTVSSKDENKVSSQRSKGNIPLNLELITGNDDTALYESLRDYILTEERLIESNYPMQHPENPDCAVLFADNKKSTMDALKRICCRCGATYSVSQTGKHVRKEECNYHYGRGVEKRVPGGVETRYSCCQGVPGAPGCQMFKLHVHDFLSLDGFVSTIPRRPLDISCPGVYSLDCEMCYTVNGLELSRVTVVNSSLQVVYDTFVKPDNEVIDYNTRFSGVSEEDVKGNNTSFSEVQETLLSFISADTILIGHGLATDLCALKMLHSTVVDTSEVFPHRLGPPYKLTLNKLTAEYLRRIIQDRVCGHDTAEDATACMELMLWKVKDGKVKR